MEDKFKIISIDCNDVTDIYIFKGYDRKSDYYIDNNISYEENREDINKYLGEDMLNEMKKNGNEGLNSIVTGKTKVHYVNDEIYLDDTIDTIKLKISQCFDGELTNNEMYLFGLQNKTLMVEELYKKLSLNNTRDITLDVLVTFLSNIVNFDINSIEFKETYTFDDLLDLNIDNKEFVEKFPISQRFIINEGMYPVIANPFDLNIQDRYVEDYTRQSVVTENRNTLVDTNPLLFNTIYLCKADRVLKCKPSVDISEKYKMMLYYPILFNNGVTNSSELSSKRPALLQQQIVKIKQSKGDMLKTNLFHEIYNNSSSKKPLDYKKDGATRITITVTQPSIDILPLDNVFKILTTNKTRKLIKFNPGERKEKVYRFFTDGKTETGKKIPTISLANLNKFNFAYGKSQSISILNTHDKRTVVVTLQNDGTTAVDIVLKDGTVEEDKSMAEFVGKILEDDYNSIVNEMNVFFSNYGYALTTVNGMDDVNVNVTSIDYEIDITYSTNIGKGSKVRKSIFNLKKNAECITPFVNIINDKITKKQENIVMRYKKISYYNEDNASEAFITEKVVNGSTSDEIIEGLMINMKKSRREAIQLYDLWVNRLQIQQGKNPNKKLRLMKHPGFLITMSKVDRHPVVKFSIRNINNIKYVKFIHMFIDTMVRLSMGNVVGVDSGYISKVCNQEYVDKLTRALPPVEMSDVLEIEEIEEERAEDEEDEDEEEERTEAVAVTEEEEPEVGEQPEEKIPEEQPKAETVTVEGEGEGEDKDEDEESDLEFASLPDSGIEESEGEESEGEESDLEFASLPGSDIEEGEEGEEGEREEEGEDEDEELLDDDTEETKRKKPALTVLGFDSSDDESDEESDYDSSPGSVATGASSVGSLSYGGARSREKEDASVASYGDIIGTKITGPNYFIKRLEERDSKLIVKKQQGKFGIYSRMCPSNLKRQPIPLNDEEVKQTIDKIGQEQFDKLQPIKYGSSSDKEQTYICPRFWCFATNTPMTKEQVERGECGGTSKIIPDRATKIPSDAFAYEFKRGQNKDTTQYFPSFISRDRHPDGLCVPCCFKNISKTKMDLQNDCIKRKDEGAEDADKPVVKSKPKTQGISYIKNIDKVILEKGRVGVLYPNIQEFLGITKTSCKSGMSVNKVKSSCLLRYGSEGNRSVKYNNKDTQSFLGALASIFSFIEARSKTNPITIQGMKKRIVKALTLDLFVGYFNGSLVEEFYNPKTYKTTNEYYRENIDELKQEILYKKIQNKSGDLSPPQERYFKRVLNAHKNFVDYINDDDEYIDYEYLWDIITTPNSILYPKKYRNGINLVILEVIDNDITNNIGIICPINSYKTNTYSPNKHTAIIIKYNDNYEPLVLKKRERKRYPDNLVFLFHENTPSRDINYSLQVRNLLLRMKGYFNKCIPTPSKPQKINNIEYTDNINLLRLEKELIKIGASVEYQVTNYNNKTIGVFANTTKEVELEGGVRKVLSGFIPCKPSQINRRMPIKFVDNDSVWTSYQETIDFLRYVSNESDGAIKSKPLVRVVEDNYIVGILTETNQMVRMLEPEVNDKVKDGLSTMNSVDEYEADTTTMTSRKYDTERKEMIENINLETMFYSMFRNTLRVVLNDYNNLDDRRELEDMIVDPDTPYYTKLDNVVRILQNLLKKRVLFTNMKREALNKNMRSSLCITNDYEKCQTSICSWSGEGAVEERKGGEDEEEESCLLNIPRINLINGEENETLYYGRLSDEIVRNTDVQRFLLQPNQVLFLDNISYNINDSEVILLQNILKDYFDNLDSVPSNSYITQQSDVFTNPYSVDDVPSNKYNLEKAVIVPNESEETEQCYEDSLIKAVYIRKNFGVDLLKTRYNNTNSNCTFYLMKHILDENQDKETDINEIRNILANEYGKLIEKHGLQPILNLLLVETNKEPTRELLLDSVKKGEQTLEQIVKDNTYYLTNLDIILILGSRNIPFLLVRPKGLKVNKFMNNIEMSKTTKTAFRRYWFNTPDVKDSYYIIYQDVLPNGGKLQGYTLLHNKRSNEISNMSSRPIYQVLTNYLKNEEIKPSLDKVLNAYKE